MKGITWTKGIGHHENGSWYIRCRLNGHEVIKAFPTRLDAESALKALRNQQKAAALGLSTIEAGETLKSLTDRYITDAEARGLSPATIRDYKAIQKKLVAYFGKRHHPRFQQKEIMEYVKHRTPKAGARLISRELKLLQTMLKHTVGMAYLTWAVPRLHDQEENAAKPVPTDAEIAGVYKALSKRPDCQRAFLLALLGALRPTDVFKAQSSDIHGDTLTVGQQKRRGSVVEVPLVETLKKAVKGVKGPLACTAPAFKKYCERQEIGWHGVHILRHTASSWAGQAGYEDEQIDILLGHATWSVAKKHYLRLPKADPFTPLRKEMLEAVEKRFLKAL